MSRTKIGVIQGMTPAEEIRHALYEAENSIGAMHIGVERLRYWRDWLYEEERHIAELEAELGKYTSAEANDYGKAVKRIAELEAKLEEVKHDKEGWYNADGYAEIVKRLDAENKRLKAKLRDSHLVHPLTIDAMEKKEIE